MYEEMFKIISNQRDGRGEEGNTLMPGCTYTNLSKSTTMLSTRRREGGGNWGRAGLID